MEIQQSMLPCNMPLLNFYLLITVTFSTPTPVLNTYRRISPRKPVFPYGGFLSRS
jgi:hypothetical protein